MPRKASSLQVTLGIALSALILLLALALAAGLGAIAVREVSSMAAGNVETLAQQMARDLSQGMDEFGRDVEGEAERAPLRDAAARTEDLRSALEAFIAAHPDISYAGLADASSGRIVAATSTLFEGGDLRGRPLFEEGRKAIYFGDVHDAARLAELLPKPFNGEPPRFIDVAAPVRDAKGNVIRVLFAHIGWQWASSMRDAVLGPMKDRRGIELLIADGAGKLVLAAGNTLASGAPLASLAAKPIGASGAVIPWIDGEYLSAQADTQPQGRFPGFGWKVAARQPVAIALAPATTLRRAFFAGALALGLIAAALAWLLTARMLRPVKRLANSALQLAPQEGTSAGRRGNEIAQVQGVLQRLASDGKSLSNAATMREMQFVTLAESLPHIVWQADAAGTIEYRNAQWGEVFGRARINRLDQLSALIHQGDLLNFMNAWNGSRISGEALHCKVRMRTEGAAGHEWFSIDGRALHDEQRRPLRWVGTITNVNDSFSQAEHSAVALTQERAARQEAERRASMRENFLAMLSHELRTPLNAIAGWAELLARRGPQDGMAARAAGVINRNVQLQAALLDDLQDNSAVVGGNIVLSLMRVDAAQLAQSVVLSSKPAAEEKGVLLECEPGPAALIEADERRIHQALTSLVCNAIKFTDAGGRITIRTTREAEAVTIAVSDTGCGLAPEALPRLFERLHQDPAQAGGSDAGLGLAIAASLVRLHGGSIEARSAGIGQGAVFTIRLPAPQAQEGGGEPISDSTGALLQRYPMTPLAGMQILLVDDEEDARHAAKALLESFGAKVAAAASAQETLRLLDARHFDLLICDIGMPGVDGFELMRAIRKRTRDKGAQMPAIALTAYATGRDQRAAYGAGFDGHVAKPLSAQTLIETICSVCEVDGQP
ncbi:ATP-binding protein [Noviherbaspirillum pedocola]|uniref:histidine kinase n=1 Tax=Noviherbaspirillum pedocola TaxID=2801341 RepID=A0A934T2B3_9BURK|nr:ATP-binding protein [Noviherbaspirillum pedocola]MBK4736538.1 response regulator [Noviherbaspirillum pedocola]